MPATKSSAEYFRDNLTYLLHVRGRGSQADLARTLDVTGPFISQLLCGSSEPNLERLDEISSHFKLRPWELIAPSARLRKKGKPKR